MWTEAAKNYIPGGESMSEEAIDAKIAAMSPFNRPGYPDDIAGVVGFLACPESQWMTGQTFHASGGAHMATS